MVEFQVPTWKDRRLESLDHAFKMFGIIGDRNNFQASRDPHFDYLKKAENYAFQANKLRMQAALQRAKNRNIDIQTSAPVASSYPSGKFGDFLRAISGQESGGNYRAVNSSSGALGKYQIMPANIPSWSQEALGRQISAQRFLNSPRLQEKIARNKLQNYFKQYGAAGAASAWYSGDPNKWNNRSPQGGYPSIHDYVMDILRAMGR